MLNMFFLMRISQNLTLNSKLVMEGMYLVLKILIPLHWQKYIPCDELIYSFCTNFRSKIKVTFLNELAEQFEKQVNS